MGCNNSKDSHLVKVGLDENNRATWTWNKISSNISTYRVTIKQNGTEPEDINVHKRCYNRKLKAGIAYDFEVRPVGKKGISEKRIGSSSTIFTKPSKPTGVVVKHHDGLYVEWDARPKNCVSYVVEVHPDNANSHECSSKELDGTNHVKFSYAFLLTQPIPSTYTVYIWAENRACEKGECRVEKFTFDGSLDIRYFILSKEEDIFICFFLGDHQSAIDHRESWEDKGYHSIDEVNCSRLYYKKEYHLNLVARNTSSKNTTITPASQQIKIQNLVNDGHTHNKFSLETTASTLKMALMFKTKDRSADDIDPCYFSWKTRKTTAQDNDVRIKEWVQNHNSNEDSDHGYETVSMTTGITGRQSLSDFKIHLDIVAKPGQVASIHSIDPDALQEEREKYITQGYKAVTDVSQEFTASSVGVIQVTLEYGAGRRLSPNHTIMLKDLHGGAVTRMFNYRLSKVNDTELHMIYRSSQRNLAPFEFPFNLEWNSKADGMELESQSRSSRKARIKPKERLAEKPSVNAVIHVSGSAGDMNVQHNNAKLGGQHHKTSQMSQPESPTPTSPTDSAYQQSTATKDLTRIEDAACENSPAMRSRKGTKVPPSKSPTTTSGKRQWK